jgi:hypothetical protein
MSHVPYPQDGVVLTSIELASLTGFDRRHIPRKAAKDEIPDARPTKSGHWEFPVTQNLRAWICFYRVRHSLLRRVRSYKDKTLRAWGPDWKTALATYEVLRLPPMRVCTAMCGTLGTFRLGPECTWEAVEAVVLTLGWIYDPKGRAGLLRELSSGSLNQN